jgi:energy-coupling factor transporter ATP-binding protein EcfA2
MKVLINSPISVNPRYKTSTRIDAQDNYELFIDDFVVHGTAINTLETLSRSYSASAQRTYTLTGPYGSGKSTLALFLSFLLSKKQEERDYASRKIERNIELTSLLQTSFEVKQGWHVIKHVCGLSSPAQSILKSICLQTNQKIEDAQLVNFNDAECINQIRAIFDRKIKGSDGFILLLDELGKALDFQSRSGGDLYIFQELADIAQNAKNNVIVLGFLHQAFVEYAKNKDALTQKDWAKVQGRYVDIGFNPSIDESLILVGDSIQKDRDLTSALKNKYEGLTKITSDSFKGQSSNNSVLVNTLPLDPLVSLLLGPISRRRFSQNERSLFGFLASNEKFGFREFINKNYAQLNESLPLYTPEMLWDYLHHNLHHVIVTSSDGKAWLEACDAIQRASAKGGELHIAITKLVALMTVFGFLHHLHASRGFVVAYLQQRNINQKDIEQAIDELERWTVVIFRQNHNALFVFQGSDIDINNLLLETIESISSGVDWTSVCNVNTPILATSHYHRMGTMRWANSLIVEKLADIDTDMLTASQLTGTAFATFIIVAKKVEDKDLLHFCANNTRVVLGTPNEVDSIKITAIELIALEYIKKYERQISHDLIAKNELESRIDDAKRNLNELFHSLLDSASWFYNGDVIKHQPLSAIASKIADLIYIDTPVVLNELVNRSKPSGSANAAINKLMQAMLTNAGDEDLGFEVDNFPPEKGIYLSCLKSKGWHIKTDEGFMFPNEWDAKTIELEPAMHKLWQSGANVIKNSSTMITMDELYRYWMAPPFGLTSGLCRIYGLALLKSLEGQVAFYDRDSTNNFIFIPELDEVFVNKLHKHPHETGVRYFEINNIQSDLINRFAEATETQAGTDTTILNIAKHIVGIVHDLKHWVKKTSGDSFIDGSQLGLTSEARAFRNEVLRANDPYKLVLESLPSIFGIDISDNNSKELVAKKLKTAINDLSSQHTMLMNGFKTIISDLLGADFDETLRVRCEDVAKTSNRANVKEFALKLANYIHGAMSFEMVVGTIAGAPERTWVDRHIRNALDEVQNLCIQFRRIESFGRLSNKSSSKPYAFITTGDKGEHKEYEIHVSKATLNDIKVEKAMTELDKLLNNLPIEQRRAVLSQLLIKNMDEVAVNENAD